MNVAFVMEGLRTYIQSEYDIFSFNIRILLLVLLACQIF